MSFVWILNILNEPNDEVTLFSFNSFMQSSWLLSFFLQTWPKGSLNGDIVSSCKTLSIWVYKGTLVV